MEVKTNPFWRLCGTEKLAQDRLGGPSFPDWAGEEVDLPSSSKAMLNLG